MKIAITGGSDGIGKETARQLLQSGHAVVMLNRPGKKSETAAADLSPYGEVSQIECDLADLSQVAEASERVKAEHPDTEVLICNAGVMSRLRKESRDGYELTFAVNHLAHFLLVTRLTDLLKRNAPARIVVVSSMVHEGASVDLDNLQMAGNYDGMRAYGQSKRANVLFVRELALRLEGTGVTANALHPGVIGTKLLHEYFSGGASVSEGAKTSVYVATSQEIGAVSGRYFSNLRRTPSSALTEKEREKSEKLWNISEELVEAALRERNNQWNQ